jgi:UPF0271 protein
MQRIDLNCDLGEAADPGQERLEALAFPYVTSVNVACGQHAGDPELMRRTVQRAKAHGASVGAHPGYPDRETKGRRDLGLPLTEIESLVASQIEALGRIAGSEGVSLTHVKPHGALYGRAARDSTLALALVRGVRSVDPKLTLVGLAGSKLVAVGREEGLRVAEEAFVDRAYEGDGHLTPRDLAGSVITDPDDVAARIERLVREGTLPSRTGSLIQLAPDTICVHGDTPGADRLLAVIRTTLQRLDVAVLSFHRPPHG